ncbi:uracil-DNA glycosylase [Hongsoonwoonella zoysiae]|uniref:uracil-DNA glycosylase n=1 Tax=Hongsoonwoonella zoysiae TaxID=2821844 RepID=UPI003CCE29F7
MTSGPDTGDNGEAPKGAAELARAYEALMDFYVGAGVNGMVDEDAVDAFAYVETQARRPAPVRAQETAPMRPAAPARPVQGNAPSAPPKPSAQTGASVNVQPSVQPSVPGDESIVAAREAAASAKTLDELHRILSRFEGCNLKRTAKNLVFADGSPNARVMFVGEAPGREEDVQGLPFVGRSGQLLDRILAAIGLERQVVYIANVVPWRPPGNRTPSPQETEICKPFIKRQIELVDPDVLVFLGGASAKALLGVTDGILRLRGHWMTYDTGKRQIRAIATLHPAYLLRNPAQKRLAWRDFLAIKAALEEGVAS